jgi:hypothetical protein
VRPAPWDQQSGSHRETVGLLLGQEGPDVDSVQGHRKPVSLLIRSAADCRVNSYRPFGVRKKWATGGATHAWAGHPLYGEIRDATLTSFNKEDVMTDRTTKALLLMIAIGLWVNLAAMWFRAVPVSAADADTTVIMRDVRAIASGSCPNKKIC